MHAFTYLALVKVVLIIALAVLAYIDLRSFRLPNAITLPLITIGIIFNSIATPPYTGLANPISSLLGAITGFALLWILDKIYYWTRRQHGIGLGDAKLLSALGAWLGVDSLPNILLIASICGVLGGILWLRYQKQTFHSAFPFGPFLAFAGIIELLWPQQLQTLILNSPT